jgi:hypothetical protein
MLRDGADQNAERAMSQLVIGETWNRWRTGRGSGQLQWRSGGPAAESFPIPE